MVEAGADILLLTGSRAFELPAESDRSLMTQVVLSSGNYAYLRDLDSGDYSLEQKDADAIGPFALGLQAVRTTEEGYVSRAVVLGCSTLLTSGQIYVMTDAQEFIASMTAWLAKEETASLDIMAKTAFRPQLSAASTGLGTVVLVALPLGVLAAALLVLGPRRHRG